MKRSFVIGLAVFLITLVFLPTVWRLVADDLGGWDLTILEERWGVSEDSFIMQQVDPHGPRFQEVQLPHPGWLLPPEERRGKFFAQVIVSGVVDLQEGRILSPEEASEDAARSAEAFFPAQPGSRWEYTGTGNEFAGFTAVVAGRNGNLVQVNIDNGGVVLGVVYEVQHHRVIERQRKPLEEPTENLIRDDLWPKSPMVRHERVDVLRDPLEVGTTWQAQESDEIHRIEAIDETLTTPAGTFTKALKIRITRPGVPDTLEYYASGVGLVKRVHLYPEPVTAELAEFVSGYKE